MDNRGEEAGQFITILSIVQGHPDKVSKHQVGTFITISLEKNIWSAEEKRQISSFVFRSDAKAMQVLAKHRHEYREQHKRQDSTLYRNT